MTLQGYAGSHGAMLNPSGGRFLWTSSLYSVSGLGGKGVAPFTVEKRFSSNASQFGNLNAVSKRSAERRPHGNVASEPVPG